MFGNTISLDKERDGDGVGGNGKENITAAVKRSNTNRKRSAGTFNGQADHYKKKRANDNLMTATMCNNGRFTKFCVLC